MKRRRRRVLHARIKSLREERGLTQEELGQRIGTDKAAVCHWENGDYAPNSHSLPLLADALGVTIDELYGEAA